ncbi:MAG: hypothetical protein LBL75_02230 [Rickettsiales bacterium]|jgi:hypothetical protein|nr:hypothetical protein [Rickettsiales bacterium]
MIGKIKKIFFNGVFGILYVGFIAQLIYFLWVLGMDVGAGMQGLMMLSVEWLVLIGARYLSKKSSGGASSGNRTGGYNNYRR